MIVNSSVASRRAGQSETSFLKLLPRVEPRCPPHIRTNYFGDAPRGPRLEAATPLELCLLCVLNPAVLI
jgi:hypothetical protein